MSDVTILHPLVRRLTAPNASAYTHTGTQTYLVGRGEVAVVDPGPADAGHAAAILAATAGERIVAIVCTHTHRDHSPAAVSLKAATGARIVGCAALVPAAGADGGVDAAYDLDYAPDRVLADGEAVSGAGWTLRAVATPGHTSNHLCYALPEADGLFSGDHVMGWSTSIVSPPDGDMGAYMASLERLVGRDEAVFWPGHGDPVDRPQRLVRGMLGHRRQREGQILRRLAAGPAGVEALVATMYAGLAEALHGAAARSVLAHLIDLERRGLVMREGAAWASTN
ncbi:MBL fold metallo-hydrolase [Sphingomonas montana]|uniref:MBL fold metallo-hydrolase n=1 Tax=Sphingomonas montana TaxID=1843236 RepID=UPI00096D728E|nr:MBL fold metallo-hydrolase [Sphingomonas montana]